MVGTTAYPAGVDNFSDPNPTDPTTSPSHAQLHQNVNAAIESLEAYASKAVRGGEDPLTVASVGAASYTVSLTGSNGVILTLTGNGALVFPTGTANRLISFFLVLKQDATGGRTRTWPASVKWAAGSAPTLSGAGKSDVFTFVTWDGGNTWVGHVLAQGV